MYPVEVAHTLKFAMTAGMHALGTVATFTVAPAVMPSCVVQLSPTATMPPRLTAFEFEFTVNPLAAVKLEAE